MRKINIVEYQLSNDDIDLVESIVYNLMSEFENEKSPGLFARISEFSEKLSVPFKNAFCSLTTKDTQLTLLLSGLKVLDEHLEPTPVRTEYTNEILAKKESFTFLFLSELLGDVFGWATQQSGKYVHDIYPLKGHENEQVSSGSEQTITLHTEDAFHPCRADYIGLMCLRNTDQIPTHLAVPDIASIRKEYLDVLFQNNYVIHPDNSHLPEFNNHEEELTEELIEARQHVSEMLQQGTRFSPFFGDRENPSMQLDRYFVDEPVGIYLDALDELCGNLHNNIQKIVLKPGQIIFFKNHKLLHGRQKFHARFDGKDRWLKRINITSDISKNIVFQTKCEQRVIL